MLDQLATGPRQPAAEGGRAVGAVAVLEAEQQAARDLVVAQHRPRPVVAWRLPGAAAAKHLGPQVVAEGKAAGGAERRREEGKAAPAGAAERAGPLDPDAADEAARRQQRIEGEPRQGADSGSQVHHEPSLRARRPFCQIGSESARRPGERSRDREAQPSGSSWAREGTASVLCRNRGKSSATSSQGSWLWAQT